ncbi:MAG: hypothetical protein JWR59_2363 [Brevundimonas sp.]|nr:hypothetical protein [Brevundimonas sp.]
MTPSTLGQALTAFRRANGIPADADTAPFWTVRIAGLAVRLRNRPWRQKAVLAHDLHHVLTGYPCTLTGEFQMAAWEAASGGFPSLGARCMCAPLILAGLIVAPRPTLAAFRRGRRTRNLHGQRIDEAFLAIPLKSFEAPAG